MIEMKCPECGHQLRISSKYAGKRGGCKTCGKYFIVPLESPPPSTIAPPVATSLDALKNAPDAGSASVFPASTDAAPPVAATSESNAEQKVQGSAFLLSAFLGPLGFDQFYLGNIGLGILKLITFGGLGLWSLIDALLIGFGMKKDHEGRALYRVPVEGTPTKSVKLALVLSWLVGPFGVDRFYLGYVGLGILKLITFGGFGVWYVVDFLLIGMGKMKDAQGNSLSYDAWEFTDEAEIPREPVEPLGFLYWVVAVFFSIVGFVWGLTLPKSHPWRKTAVFVPLAFAAIHLVLTGLLVVWATSMLPGQLESFVADTASEESLEELAPNEYAAKFAHLTPAEAKQELYDRGIHMSGRTFIQHLQRKSYEELELFFIAGIDVNERNDNGGTALDYLSGPSSSDMALYLLERGVDPNIVSDIGGSPLYYAVQGNVMSVVRELLKRGADPNLGLRHPQESRKVMTSPLMLAAHGGELETLQLLLDHGARLETRDGRNMSALDYARQEGHGGAVDLLSPDPEEPSARLANASPGRPSGGVQGEPAEVSGHVEELDEPEEYDDHFKVVVYGIPEDAPYDTRIYDVMIPAVLKGFPASDYPGIGEVEEAYRTLTANPSNANGEKMEEIFNAFVDPFDEAETEKFQELYFDVVLQEMAAMQAKIALETLDALVAAFPRADYPLLDDVVSTTRAFAREPDDAGSAKVDRAINAFEAGLNRMERAESKSIRETTEERLMAGDPAEIGRQVIRGWVDNLELARSWINSDLGAVVSPGAFDRLAENMKYSEVKALVGREGRQTASLTSSFNGNKTIQLQYEWSWPLGSGTTARIGVWFLNGQLRLKFYNEVQG
jgi:TM2 domain-containing membrane protein YozV